MQYVLQLMQPQYKQMEFNRLIAFRETKRNWDIHQKNLKNIKPMVQTGRNHTLQLKRQPINRKTESTIRLMDIQFQNKALLCKLTKQKCKTDSNSRSSQVMIVRKKSNKRNAFEQYNRNVENRDLLKRIQNTKPNYKMEEYVEKYKENEKYATMICNYSYKGKKLTKSRPKLEMTNDVSKYFTSRKNDQSIIQNSFQDGKISRNQEGRTSSNQEGRTSSNQDGRTSRNRELQKSKINPPSKVVKIYPNFIKEADGKEFMIRGILYQEELVIEIHEQQNLFRLALPRLQFQQNYDGSYTNICKRIEYSAEQQEFYFK